MNSEDNSHDLRPLRRFSVGYLGVFGLIYLIGVAVLIAVGHPLTAIVALCVAVSASAAMKSWMLMRTAVAWGSTDSTGTTIRIDKRIEPLVLLAFSSVGVGFAVLAVLATVNKLVVPIPLTIGRIYTGLLSGLMSLVLVVFVVIVLRRPGICSVRLTSDRFTIAEGFTTSKGNWADVTDITGVAPEGVAAPCPVTFVMRAGKPKVLKNSAGFSPDGRVLLDYVRFYWQHPEYRAELTDGRALDRLQALQQTDGRAEP